MNLENNLIINPPKNNKNIVELFLLNISQMKIE